MKQWLFFLLVLIVGLAGLDKALGRNIVLEWNPSVSPDAAGYYVYYGTSSGSYTCKIDAGNATSMTISNLSCGITYYFAATAYDTNGGESAFSSEVSFVADGVLTMTSGSNPGAPGAIQFPVEPGHWYEVQATADMQNWNCIWQSDVAASNVWTQFTDPDASCFPSRFYRLVVH